MNILTGLALIVALTAATACFAAQEFAHVAAGHGRPQRDAEHCDPRRRKGALGHWPHQARAGGQGASRSTPAYLTVAGPARPETEPTIANLQARQVEKGYSG